MNEDFQFPMQRTFSRYELSYFRHALDDFWGVAEDQQADDDCFQDQMEVSV